MADFRKLKFDSYRNKIIATNHQSSDRYKPEMYTGHCFYRRTNITYLAEAGF